MGTLRVVCVHGLAPVTLAELKESYSAPLQRGLRARLTELGVIPIGASDEEIAHIITFHEVDYSEIGQDVELRVLDAYMEKRAQFYGALNRLRPLADLDALRHQVVTSIGDVLVYKSAYWGPQIRKRVAAQIHPFLHSGDPVTVIGGSLGSVVAFDTLYFNLRDNPEWRAAGWRPANFITLGSPIALFSLDLEGDETRAELKYRGAAGGFFPLVRPGGVWYNLFDMQDVLAYPLEVLMEGRFLVEDFAVQTGANPFTVHTHYWGSEDVIEIIAGRLQQDFMRMRAAEAEKLVEYALA